MRVLVFPPKSGISVWLCSLWELSHPRCFASPLPQAILSWHLIFLSLLSESLHPCSLGVLSCQLCSPRLLLLLPCLQAVLTRSRHTGGFALNKSSSPFLFFCLWHRRMPKRGTSVMSSTFFSQLQGLLKKTMSRWLPECLQRRRTWLHLSFEASFQQGVVTRRRLWFLPPRVWSCFCREALL